MKLFVNKYRFHLLIKKISSMDLQMLGILLSNFFINSSRKNGNSFLRNSFKTIKYLSKIENQTLEF